MEFLNTKFDLDTDGHGALAQRPQSNAVSIEVFVAFVAFCSIDLRTARRVGDNAPCSIRC
jgi:hypothetical protein